MLGQLLNRSRRRDLILHIGLSKTGSTYLQQQLFPRVEALGRHCSIAARLRDRFEPGGMDLEQAMKWHCKNSHPLIWREPLGEQLLQAMATATDQPHVLFSEESLYFLRGLFMGQGPALRALSQPRFVGDHLRGIRRRWAELGHGNVKVLVFIRPQWFWLASRYVETSDSLPDAGQAHFEEQLDRLLGQPLSRGAQTLDYALLLAELEEAVGSSHVLMLPFEPLSQPKLHHLLADFCQLPALAEGPLQQTRSNQRQTSSRSWKLKPLKPGLHTNQPRQQEIHLTVARERDLRQFFEPGNRKLDQLLPLERQLGLNLLDLDYYWNS